MAIDGAYNVTADTPMGKMSSTLTLQTDDGLLSGSMSTGMMGKAKFSGGKIDGNSFNFNGTMKSILGKMEMSGSGKVDGDSISGEVKTSKGNFSFNGTRV